MSKKQQYYTLRKDYCIKVEKYNKILEMVWNQEVNIIELEKLLWKK